MTEEKALIEIKEAFTINGELNERYYHTLGVIEKALELNEIHNLKIPKEQVFLSAAFHDVAKFLDKKSMLEILDKYFHNIYQSLQNTHQYGIASLVKLSQEKNMELLMIEF